MIRHIVAWNFKDEYSNEENRANAERIKEEVESLVDYINEIIEIKVIINPEKTSNRDVVLNSLFKSEQDLANYQVHPKHKRVGQFIGTVMKDRVCLDFYE